jgi:hypothetical protein
MNKENPDDDAGIMVDLTIQACDKLVERVWLKALQEGPMDLDDMVKCTVVLANCVSIVTMVIDNADDFIDDTNIIGKDMDDDSDEDDED